MPREVHLNELDKLLTELTYPTERSRVRSQYEDVVLLYADGEEAFVEVVARTGTDRFDSADELSSALYSALPVEAVGEPGQSEGTGEGLVGIGSVTRGLTRRQHRSRERLESPRRARPRSAGYPQSLRSFG